MANELITAVSSFLDEIDHPLRPEIDRLRIIILGTGIGLTENIKWNGPNYSHRNEDRITMSIQPPKQIQLILHRGAKKQEQPQHKLIDDPSGLLNWRGNDRAVIPFKNMADIENRESDLVRVIKDWIAATS